MTTPASAAPAPITASPATSEPVKGNVLELFAVLAATWEPGSLGGCRSFRRRVRRSEGGSRRKHAEHDPTSCGDPKRTPGH